MYKNDSRFKILEYHYTEAKGACWARNLVQQEYLDEEYTLQIDSHVKMIKNWDKILIDAIKYLQEKGYKKPAITGYPPDFSDEVEVKETPYYMFVNDFYYGEIPVFKASPLQTNKINKTSIDFINAYFYSAGFCFTVGDFCKEIQHDPEIYFIGEEISIAVRAYTWGYDFFHPTKVLLLHYYLRNDEPKHWEDHGKWNHSEFKSLEKVKKLLGINCKRINYLEYGLGHQRTISEFEYFSGVKFNPAGLSIWAAKEQQINSVSEKSLNKRKYLIAFFEVIRIPLTKISLSEINSIQIKILTRHNRVIKKYIYTKNSLLRKNINAKEIQIPIQFNASKVPYQYEVCVKTRKLATEIIVLKEKIKVNKQTNIYCNVL